MTSTSHLHRLFGDHWGNKREEAYSLLSYIHTVFSEVSLPYFIVAGTLLGYIRHGDFIPWDDDMDIMIMKYDLPVLLSLQKKFEEDGYLFFSFFENHHYKLSFMRNESIGGRPWSFPFVDIFVSATESVVSTEVDLFKRKIQRDLVFPLITVDNFGLNKIKVKIPHDSRKMLFAHYGPLCLTMCAAPTYIHSEEKPSGYPVFSINIATLRELCLV